MKTPFTFTSTPEVAFFLTIVIFSFKGTETTFHTHTKIKQSTGIKKKKYFKYSISHHLEIYISTSD